MSTSHCGPVELKPIGQAAEYLLRIIPDIPQSYALKPMFGSIAGEDAIRGGVLAFREFLLSLCNKLMLYGELYDKPPKKPKNDLDYPFLHSISNLLLDIGYYGSLTKGGDKLTVERTPSFNGRLPVNCIEFLKLCGFTFGDTNDRPFTVMFPANPVLLTGLKALATADFELRAHRYTTDASIFRCDYRLLKAEATDRADILKDILHPLPRRVQDFAMELHKRHTDMGLTCETMVSAFDTHVFYSHTKNSKRALTPRDMYYLRIWEFGLSLRHGCRLVVRAKKTAKYADVIEGFPLPLRALIDAGYGCDRKLRNERCQNGCQGYRIPLDESILEIGGAVRTWLDTEVFHAAKLSPA